MCCYAQISFAFTCSFFTDAKNSTCKENEFQCKTVSSLYNRKCISYDLVCNKESDCPDGSDEPLHCGVNECARVQVKSLFFTVQHEFSLRIQERPQVDFILVRILLFIWFINTK